MRYRWILLGTLIWAAAATSPALASTGDIGSIVEKFVVRQFPDAASHYWVINETQWDGDEMIVDVQAVVKERRDTEPTLSRFLLLIVAGELKGSQNVPLEPAEDCRTEDT
jgi:hypothetical protein